MNREIPLPAPLFRDPIYDCPTDPTVIWNREEKQWYLFYTQRRATDTAVGVSWVHGTRIGVAVSEDGAKWLYRGTLENLDIERGHNTFWAPEILWAQGAYHMYVSYITGIPTDWDYPRRMLHYVSQNLWDWDYLGDIDLQSARVIDACVYETEPGLFKMWYKDENRESRTYAAVSRDLHRWEVVGEEISDCAQEGPNVFSLGGKIWMISDFWSGLAVYSSDDCAHWTRCPNLLDHSGTRPMDVGLGRHADVVVRGDRAFLFYFCHPYACELPEDGNNPADFTVQQRNMAVVQAVELFVRDGVLTCDRSSPASWPL